MFNSLIIINFVKHVGNLEAAELADLQRALKPVIEWFSLGVELKIPVDALSTIRKDYRLTDDCRLEMLIQWKQMESPTWSKLVTALVAINRKALANQLANKYGKVTINFVLQGSSGASVPSPAPWCY